MRWRVIPLAGCYLSPITTTLKKDFNRTPHDARRGRNSSVLIRSPVWLDRFSHKSDITSPQGTPAGHKSFIRSIRIYVRMYVYTYIYIYTHTHGPLDSSGEQNGNGSVKGLLDNGAARRFRCTNTGWMSRRRRRERLHMRIERIAVERRCKNAGWYVGARGIGQT